MVEDGEGGVTTGGGNIARFDGALLYVAQFCMSSNAQHRGDGGLPSSSNSNGGGAQDVHARDNIISSGSAVMYLLRPDKEKMQLAALLSSR